MEPVNRRGALTNQVAFTMEAMMDFLFRDSQTWLKALVMGCPFMEILPSCPLREIRLLPVNERLQWIRQLDPKGIDTIISYHKNCLENREKNEAL